MSSAPVNHTESIQEETVNLIQCHIVNLSDHYLDVDKTISKESREIITDTLNHEIQNTANAVATMQKAGIITLRQSLSCMVRLAEVKSDYLKL